MKICIGNVVSIAFGVDFGLGNFDYVSDDTLLKSPRLLLSTSIGVPIELREKKEYKIVIYGTLYDSTTKEPLYGYLSFCGPLTRETKSNRKKGRYKMPLEKPGAYRIRAHVEDYKWQEKVVRSMTGDTIKVDFAFKQKVKIEKEQEGIEPSEEEE